MIRWTILIALTSSLTGCMSGPGRQTVWHKAVAEQQQEAVVHDPYANENIAPEIDGGRPREYQKDFAEPQRDTFLQQDWLVPPRP